MMQQPISQAPSRKLSDTRGFILFAMVILAALLIVSTALGDFSSTLSRGIVPGAGLQKSGCLAMGQTTFMQLPQGLQMELNGTCSDAAGIQP